jgi:hypothetical protein
MNVRVDDARENGQSVRIDFRFCGSRQVFRDRDKFPFADSDVLLASHEQIEITHVRTTKSK